MRIAILGAGNMGGWLAQELAADGNEVAVYDHDTSKAARLSGVLVLKKLEDVSSFQPQLLLNAVSLQNTIAAFEEVEKLLPANCALAEVASVKTGLPQYYKKSGRRFFSSHPMFGPTFANVQTLSEESVVFISESDRELSDFFRKFYTKRQLKLFEYGFSEHDGMMAYSLTLPFVSSFVFAACMDSTVVPGTTFKRHLSIAKGLLSEDDSLLAEILFNPSSAKQIDKVNSRLEFLKHIIKARDSDEAKRFFEGLRKNLG